MAEQPVKTCLNDLEAELWDLPRNRRQGVLGEIYERIDTALAYEETGIPDVTERPGSCV